MHYGHESSQRTSSPLSPNIYIVNVVLQGLPVDLPGSARLGGIGHPFVGVDAVLPREGPGQFAGESR